MDTDKKYWHGYLDEYERIVFSELYDEGKSYSDNILGHDELKILEIGVGNGASMQLLRRRFPHSEIIGADIEKPQEGWPTCAHYVCVDQSSRSDLSSMFESLGTFDLIIDDGSHRPEHQVNSLIEGLKFVKAGGYYIIEDIHTSYSRSDPVNAFHLLLALKHIREAYLQNTDEIIQKLLAKSSLFTGEDINSIFDSIQTTYFYRRAKLPIICYRCNGTDFDYVKLRCSCGEDLYSDNDSMAFIIQKKKGREKKSLG